jgi:hypothetical protein
MRINWQNANKQERILFESILRLTDGRKELLEFIFDPVKPRLRKRPGLLRDDCWHLSHGEILLVQGALDMWSGAGHLAFWECLETWDNSTWINFILAICKLKGIDLQEIESGHAEC